MEKVGAARVEKTLAGLQGKWTVRRKEEGRPRNKWRKGEKFECVVRYFFALEYVWVDLCRIM